LTSVSDHAGFHARAANIQTHKKRRIAHGEGLPLEWALCQRKMGREEWDEPEEASRFDETVRTATQPACDRRA
jgi:hypothetical protein